MKKLTQTEIDALVAKARKPAADAMALHPFYKGKYQTVPKCCIRDFNDFAIWYTPGVAAPCKDIQAHPEKSFEHTNRANTICVLTDGMVTELGSHEKLLAGGGFYSRLHAQQTQ